MFWSEDLGRSTRISPKNHWSMAGTGRSEEFELAMGELRMRVVLSWIGAVAVGITSCLSTSTVVAQEPPRPTASSSEANPAVPAPGHSVHGEAFNDGPRRSAYLMPGQGKVHFAVTTSRADARAFVDQGVVQLHSFAYFEAERSFRQAAKLDPDCAMAYWG